MATKSPNPKLGLDDLAAQYGYAATFFNSDSELKALISQAVKEQWTPEKFKAKFMATNWYRARAADTRTWIELEARDPAEATDRINNQKIKIQQIANKMGIALNAPRLQQMARDSLMFGWPDDLINQSVAAEWHYVSNGGTQGGAATLETQIKQLAGDYGVTVSDAQVADWVGGSLAGKYTQDHLDDFVRDMARSKYPGLTSYLDQGFTVRQVASPYLQSYSTILEQNPDSVQLTDPLVQKALQGTPDAKGVPVAQSVYDFEKSLRADPRWLTTKNAHQQLTSVGLGVLRDMGLYS